MSEIDRILSVLESGPALLATLVQGAPAASLQAIRIPGKWTIHQHACHLATVDRDVFFPRFEKFRNESRPQLRLSMPPDADAYYAAMDLERELDQFAARREKLCAMAREVDAAFWEKVADHPKLQPYTPRTMLQHWMFHDHLHMYRIEELAFLRDEYLPGK